ncbi:D-glycero-beta-D-manno-heptose 1-phosphate adenylyltransferase [Hoyosella sp. YIM 151337]|uniref:D-glycero-beta-D-manno-heptose 1-phosphate adenylyltransferase n=1 Tax=Hoyosella sp. YIM 151337 TaxID=2992742 RepID=UPI002235A563|nr:D-glycero-beta-D-manno-heptose 1-phosphate adenylyltransferase [Hoyosella sp. YIM 151337]MCW4355507.1 D-glycero-beta-D-manno-heptose 1-phosphate adenylyltransferase [Hoyosella sp. YIM 151337]
MSQAPLVVLGDVLLDRDINGVSTRRCPDSPSAPAIDVTQRSERPGGAGLAALIAARAEHRVILVTAMSDDDEAQRLQQLLAPHVTLCPLPATGRTTTKTRVQVEGRTVARMDDGDCRADIAAPFGRTVLDALAGASAILVADYGRDVTRHPALRDALTALASSIPIVWDPHPRGATPIPGCALVTPNLAEARTFSGSASGAAEHATVLRRTWCAAAVAVTASDEGAYVNDGHRTTHVKAPRCATFTEGLDVCGAGDCFSATAAAHLAAGADSAGAVTEAVHAATQYVLRGGASRLSVDVTARNRPSRAGLDSDPYAIVQTLRANGRRIVATGGCFDLLHRGHLSLLRAARALGDALVVCLNSDASVRRLKGATRPVLSEADRAQTLRELATVDAVVIFDEDDPREVLQQLRPDVWVKGGDYEPIDLPEADVIRRYGGDIVIVPTVGGYSTTSLLRRLQADGARHSS